MIQAREGIVRRLIRFAKRLAGRYRHSGESQEDLEPVACVSLIKAPPSEAERRRREPLERRALVLRGKTGGARETPPPGKLPLACGPISRSE